MLDKKISILNEMQKASLRGITFDKEDATLLSLNTDLELKAKSVQNSILPKLNILMEEAIGRIRAVYDVEIFENDMSINISPNFRKYKRKGPIKTDYYYAAVGMSGRRYLNYKLTKANGNFIKILPFSLSFILTENGLYTDFYIGRLMSKESKRIYVEFLTNNLQYITTMLHFAEMQTEIEDFHIENKNEKMMINFTDFINKTFEECEQVMSFYRFIKFPIDLENLCSAVNSFIIMYPILDSLVKIALGKKDSFSELISKIKYKDCDYLFDKYFPETDIDSVKKDEITKEEINSVLENHIDNKIPVRAGIRWQVFERDDFKCVACGKSAEDGAILHVDHILPRSKGGKDEMSNYQTLCHLCNIGKSNKSDKKLRKNILELKC